MTEKNDSENTKNDSDYSRKVIKRRANFSLPKDSDKKRKPEK